MHCYRIFRINYPNLTSTLNISNRTDILVATPVSERDRDQRQDPYRQLMYTVRGRLYSSWWSMAACTRHNTITFYSWLHYNSYGVILKQLIVRVLLQVGWGMQMMGLCMVPQHRMLERREKYLYLFYTVALNTYPALLVILRSNY